MVVLGAVGSHLYCILMLVIMVVLGKPNIFWGGTWCKKFENHCSRGYIKNKSGNQVTVQFASCNAHLAGWFWVMEVIANYLWSGIFYWDCRALLRHGDSAELSNDYMPGRNTFLHHLMNYCFIINRKWRPTSLLPHNLLYQFDMQKSYLNYQHGKNFA